MADTFAIVVVAVKQDGTWGPPVDVIGPIADYSEAHALADDRNEAIVGEHATVWPMSAPPRR